MIRLLAAPLMFIALILQSIRLALSQIWANKMRSTLTTIGIVIGVASVTAVIAALTGLKAKVLKDFETIGTNKIFIVPHWPREGRFRHFNWRHIRFIPRQFEDLLERCPSIENYTLMTERSQTVYHGVQSIEGASINGINPSWHRIENRSVIVGRPFTLTDEENGWQVCLITPDVRDELRLDRDCIGKRIVIGRRSFEIVGVVEDRVKGMFGAMGSSKEVFIPFETAWRLWEPWIYAIASCRKPELSKEAQAELRFYLRQARSLGPGDPDTFRLQVIEEFQTIFKGVAMTVTVVAGGIVGISLLVGGVGIMNIMLVSVSERTHEIGLRKAVGAKPSAILLQFLVESVVLCLFGGLLGVGLGQCLTSIIANLPHADLLDMAYIPLWAIGLSFGFSATVGVFFGMFPAIKAARLDPIEALRHE